jgi:hypothetical protein
MKKALVFFVFLASIAKFYSQEIPIIWSDLQKNTGSLMDILPKTREILLRYVGREEILLDPINLPIMRT